MLGEVSQPLYEEQPNCELFHYTSFDALMGIVPNKVLWATEISYLNDTKELRLFTDWMHVIIRAYDTAGSNEKVAILAQLTSWINHRLIGGSMIFTTSFTENGNLLSQWRGYCQHGRGVSLGFDPGTIVAAAAQAEFTIGRCIYDWQRHHQLAQTVVDRLVAHALEAGPHPDATETECFYPRFAQAASDIIRIAVLCKHPSFAEEQEWRCISRPVTNYVEAPLKYRVGSSALIPYLEFPLPTANGALAIKTAIVGPSPTPDLALKSIARYLRKYARAQQPRSVQACGIPYRA